MTAAPKAATLAAALVAAQAELPPVDKNGRNPHYGSAFVTLDDLIGATREVLNRHGLAILQFPAVSELGAPTLVTRLIHTSGESIEYQMPLVLGAQSMQALGAAITYARRFAWSAALGVASDTDDDGESAQPAEPAKDDERISDAQRRRLFAIASARKVDEARLRTIVLEATGQESTTAILRSQYDAIVRQVDEDDVPF